MGWGGVDGDDDDEEDEDAESDVVEWLACVWGCFLLESGNPRGVVEVGDALGIDGGDSDDDGWLLLLLLPALDVSKWYRAGTREAR